MSTEVFIGYAYLGGGGEVFPAVNLKRNTALEVCSFFKRYFLIYPWLIKVEKNEERLYNVTIYEEMEY